MFSTRLDEHLYMIDLKPAGFPQFIASYVVKARKVAVVETGPTVTAPNLLAGLNEIGVDAEEVEYVLVSHIHLDHAGGAGMLLRHLPKAKLIVHRKGAPHLESPWKLWTRTKEALGKVARLYKKPVPISRHRIVVAEDGMTFNLGQGVELRVIETLGHASHHQSFLEKKGNGVFLGDAAGIYIPKFDAVIPTTPQPFFLESTLASIERLKQLEPKMLYYSHFGPVVEAMENLGKHSTQLRLWANIVSNKLNEGAAESEIEEEIVEADHDLNRAREYVRAHPILGRGHVRQNLRGFIGYLERKSKQS